MKKTTVSRISQVLKSHWEKMTPSEMAWVVFQIDNNIPLDKAQALVTEWYAKKGRVGEVEEWVRKNL